MGLIDGVWPEAGIRALFEEAPGGGDPLDIDALCNRPAKYPESWLDFLKLHSELNYLEVAAENTLVRSHSGASAGSTPSAGSAFTIDAGNPFGYKVNVETFTVCTHDLGYPPYAAVVVNGTKLISGMPVQIGSGGAARYASAFVTPTQVRVQTWCSVGTSALPAADITYKAIAFRNPPAKSGNVMDEFDPETGVVSLAFGKVRSDRKYLQIDDGGSSPFGILLGRGGDLNNGAPRFARTNGSTYDPVPGTTKLRAGPSPISAFGSAMTYGGSYSAPSIVQVQVPDDPPGGASGDAFDPVAGTYEMTFNGRPTLSGAGKLVGLLPEVTIDDQALAFPDLTKTNNYWWRWQSSGFAPGPYTWLSQGQELVVAPPQEYDTTTVLMAVPDGADFIVGRVRLNRTSAPDNWLFNDPLEVIPAENVWLPFMGALTVMVEAGYGFARMFSVYISGSNLVLRREQSVSVAPGGYGTWDNGSGFSGGVGGAMAGSGVGTPGILVKAGTGKLTEDTAANAAGVGITLHKWDGGDPDNVTDTTDFSSTYSLDLRFSFGRVS